MLEKRRSQFQHGMHQDPRASRIFGTIVTTGPPLGNSYALAASRSAEGLPRSGLVQLMTEN